ncbi:hypothetical protein glysoja_025790 [Glycine soja]|uniref:Uncharacterized protein n=1 Tax=Glycine soja TaxID=3848 RepID=A0A0B2RC18_GLYSO|nr:hypothetical protein glysoja_025790 [Glycine soja]
MVTMVLRYGMQAKLSQMAFLLSLFIKICLKFEFKILYKLFKLYITIQVKNFIYCLQNI